MDRRAVRHGKLLALPTGLGEQTSAEGTHRRISHSGLVVQKYGGSSVADPESIRRVARRIAETRAAGNRVVVVVSAMGDTTDDLLDLANAVTPEPSARELDVLLTSGEQVSVALLGIALAGLKLRPKLFTGNQTGLKTDEVHGKAHILDIDDRHVAGALNRGEIPIVAGFQGRSQKSRETTTLGRGGSDITAIALAASLGASVCEIYTDVGGVYTADPRIVPTARKINVISSEEMLALAASGAKILHTRCVEYAHRFGVLLHVRSSFNHEDGTLVVPAKSPEHTAAEGFSEQPIVASVAYENSTAKITLDGIPDTDATTARIFAALFDAGAVAEMAGQSISPVTGLASLTVAIPASTSQAASAALRTAQPEIGFTDLELQNEMGKLALNGSGMRLDPDVTYKFFQALADAGTAFDLIASSDFRLSVLMPADQLPEAVQAVRRRFGWEAASGVSAVQMPPAAPAVLHLSPRESVS